MTELPSGLPCGLLAVGDDGVVVAVNDTLLGYLDRTADELVGAKLESILTVASRIFYQTHLYPLLALHGHAEEIFVTLRSRSAEVVPVLVNAVRRETCDGVVTRCALMPVYERQKYEEEILKAKRSAEEALRSNRALIETKDELERRTRDLDRQLDRLRLKNQELTRIGHIFSHDLRAPVRKIGSFAGILHEESGEALSPMGRLALDRVRSEAEAMDRLVGTLRQYVLMDTIEEVFEQVELDDVVTEASLLVSEKAGLEAGWLERSPLPAIEGNRSQLVLLFQHLLDNATTFRRPDTPARVSLDSRIVQENSFRVMPDSYRYADVVRIVLRDNGVGFDPKYADQVIEVLAKLDPGGPGLGFGLAVCKKVVDNHRGAISLDSAVGVGTEVVVVLPLQQ